MYRIKRVSPSGKPILGQSLTIQNMTSQAVRYDLVCCQSLKKITCGLHLSGSSRKFVLKLVAGNEEPHLCLCLFTSFISVYIKLICYSAFF